MSLFIIAIYKSIGKLFLVQRYYEGLILGTAEPVKIFIFLGGFPFSSCEKSNIVSKKVL